MSNETPLAVLLRRRGLENPELYQALFSDVTKLPTLTQFLPEMFYFEEDNGSLYCSAYSGLPLVRYDLKDRGGVFNLESIKSKLGDIGIDLEKELKQAKIEDAVWNLPFVYVYERSDFSVSFFAFQIYPETIRKALQDESLEDQLTGKFTMAVRYDEQGRQIFELHVELKAGTQDSQPLRELVTDLAMQRLLQENSEYRQTYDMEGEDRVKPAVILYPYEHPEHFRPGTKQKWVKK